MSAGDLYAQFPRLNPAIWRPLMGLEAEPIQRTVENDLSLTATSSCAVHTKNDDSCAPTGSAKRGANFALPCASERDGTVEFPEQKWAGAAAAQLQKAALMHAAGLRSKARRQASCAIYGRIWACENAHEMYHRFFCKNRYCTNPACGQRFFRELFDKYIALDEVACAMVPQWENRPHRKPRAGERVIAKIDITTVNTGRMPTRGDVQLFNRNIRRLFRAAEREFGLSFPKRVKQGGHLVPARSTLAGDYGVLWTDEFGGAAKRAGKRGNSNLHAHAVYCGPFIPQDWLSRKWSEICGDGSKIISIKSARTFRAALYHALKYAGKFLSSDPARLAELELAFDRVRRVHTMGGFYNALHGAVQPKASPRCPHCDGVMLDPIGPLRSVRLFEMQGIFDFDLVSRESRRNRIFQNHGNGSG
jgi:hypothetical protein